MPALRANASAPGMLRPANPRAHRRAYDLTSLDGLVQAPYLPHKTFGDGNDVRIQGCSGGSLINGRMARMLATERGRTSAKADRRDIRSADIR